MSFGKWLVVLCLLASTAFAATLTDTNTSFRARKRICELGDTACINWITSQYDTEENLDLPEEEETDSPLEIVGMSGDALEMNITDGTSPGNPVEFMITNTGTGETGTLSVSLTGNTENFEKMADTCHGTTLAASASCIITIQPVATENGVYSATLVVSAPEGTATQTLFSEVSGFPGGYAGGLYAWGSNKRGELGDGTSQTRITPALVFGMDTENIGIPEAGGEQSCALQNGALKCWGSNNYGQVGDGSTTNRFTPVQVVGMESGVTAVDGGQLYHTCAIQNGAAKCWGQGYGPTPKQVVGLSSGVTAIGVGRNQTCAIQNGAAKCWGGTYGTTPVQISGLTSGVTAVDAGYSFACAIQNGAAKCWGYNSRGQLGNGTTTNNTAAVQVTGLTSGVSSITLGLDYACAIHNNIPKCWGTNTYGQLGDGTTTSRTTPVLVSGLTSGVSRIDAGYYHTCTIQNGSVKCWGNSAAGGSGVASTTIPTQVPGMEGGVVEISAGNQHTLALRGATSTSYNFLSASATSGDALAMDIADGVSPGSPVIFTITNDGDAETGVLSVSIIGNAGNFSKTTDICTGNTLSVGESCTITAVPVATENGTYSASLVVGSNPGGSVSHAMLSRVSGFPGEQTGVLFAWGRNLEGTFGNGTTTSSNIPVRIPGFEAGLSLVKAGGSTSCAIQNGALECWGTNNNGQVGDGSYISRNTPVQVVGMASGVTAVDGGLYYTTCAIQNGAAKCWGKYYGNTPQQVPGLTSGMTALSVGRSHACAIQSGAVKCWNYGSTPVQVTDLESGVSAVEAGNYFSCALQAGAVKCWGSNNSGELGNGTTTSSNIPVQVVGLESGVTALTTTMTTGCAIQDGSLKCWGNNNYGQLGDGTKIAHTTPIQVLGMESGVTDVEGGYDFVCGLQNGGVKCWGYNYAINYGSTPITIMGMESGVAAITCGNHHTFAVMSGSWILAPAGYSVAFDTSSINLANRAAASFTLYGAQLGATYTWSIDDTGNPGTSAVTGTGTVTSATQQFSGLNLSGLSDGMLTLAIMLEDDGHAGAEMTDIITKDSIVPGVSSLSPADNASGVALDANLVLTFGEDITKGTGNIIIYNGGGTVFETIAVTDAKVTVSGNQATINPIGTFAYGAGYYITVASGAFVDESGNPQAVISGSSAWNFTSVLAPAVLSINPLSASGMDVAGGGAETGTYKYGTGVSFTVANCSGCQTTTALSVELSGSNFEIVSNGCSSTLASGATCTVTVRPMADRNVASYTATLTASATTGGSASASLSGAATGFVTTLTGGVYAWGAFGGTITEPLEMPGIGSGVSAVEADGEVNCIIQNGAAKCWGNNAHGSLGDGTYENRDAPVQVVGLTSGITAINAGKCYHACAIHNGAAKCWGSGAVCAGNSILGDDAATYESTTPVQVSGLTSNVTSISAGRAHTCAVQGGAIKCWGNWYGYDATPVQIGGLASGATAVDTGYGFSCAIQNGAAKCWGIGPLGDGITTSSETAVQVSGLTSGVTDIATTMWTACAVQSGALKCWGSNGSGELGNGTGGNSAVPVQVPGLESGVTDVSAGYSHLCAIHNGAAKCWGYDWVSVNSSTPVQVTGLESDVIDISAGNVHTLALKQ
ncbi:MAG TPA: hypothetical protein DCW68_06610 [Rhodospirillaceae bacterium]|nr:MAG: hypothetical protein A2018_01120 [Alphaproteobacteria bacterium GWF2_58_20]HAU29759.1 hypothetical protein [Rhodospirillaceae bacterium]